ncbi:MAG: hypothetical protein PHT54_01760 [Candidatus Nanoarchaeia archaeon]|nr:hypothetical protein [Candidatus Nanoarchaeia archaeon]
MLIQKKGWMFLFTLIVFSYSVYAFGVNAPYWESNPLTMYPGQTKDIQLTLQNMVGDKNLELEASITSGNEIAKLIDQNNVYPVPFGRKDVPVNIKITIPDNAELNKKYEVEISFKETAAEGGQMVQMSGSVGTKIPIIITSAEEASSDLTGEATEKTETGAGIFLVVIVLVVVVILVLYLKKGKKPKK